MYHYGSVIIMIWMHSFFKMMYLNKTNLNIMVQSDAESGFGHIQFIYFFFNSYQTHDQFSLRGERTKEPEIIVFNLE